MNDKIGKFRKHYLVQINAPDGIRPLICFSDLDVAYAFARNIDWAQIVVMMEAV